MKQQVPPFDIVGVPLSKGQSRDFPGFFKLKYRISFSNYSGNPICLLTPKRGGSFSPIQLHKQQVALQEKIQIPIIFVFNQMPYFHIERCAQKKINFVMPGRRIFIPVFGLDWHKKDEPASEEVKKLTPLAEMLLLYHLNMGSLHGKTISQLAQMFDRTYITTYRALKAIEKMGLCELFGTPGLRVRFVADNAKLKDAIHPFLQV